jgi:FtsP/CotA-like multicopper oxidase with cupredoxin domain
VNGAVNPSAVVPNRLVRLRLVNASNARIYELSFSDQRSFHWIGTEGGLLERAVEIAAIALAPGQRAELLVDFTDGRAASLVTAIDSNNSMTGGMGMMGRSAGRTNANAPATVVRFEPRPMGQARASGRCRPFSHRELGLTPARRCAAAASSLTWAWAA